MAPSLSPRVIRNREGAPAYFEVLYWDLASGAGALRFLIALLCAVLSGDKTALLLTPGTGVCKPALVRRRDTDRRWRQVTKLPKPFPQYLPFTLRYVLRIRYNLPVSATRCGARVSTRSSLLASDIA